jgi:UDP-2,3-diacylglucosamine pyrophosphatase LpxH
VASERVVYVISDLHIGGDTTPMLGHPEKLVNFLHGLAKSPRTAKQDVELVINGDIVDFLATAPYAGWTSKEDVAVEKLRRTVSDHRKIFSALAAVAKVARITLILGNHDIELAYPKVRDLLFREIGTDSHRCHFVWTNEAYRIGDVHIEHGNRYDPWNAIDHDGLREIVSCASRGESPPRDLQIAPGSLFVHEVMNPLKHRYHFVDLLKPEDKIVALILSALEPGLVTDLPWLFRAAVTYAKNIYRRVQWGSDSSGRSAQRQLVSANAIDAVPSAISKAFRSELTYQARQPVGAAKGLRKDFLKNPSKTLRADIESGRSDSEQIQKLQVALREKLIGDTSFDLQETNDECGRAAMQLLHDAKAKVVIMGHTHLKRVVTRQEGMYMNTGTWADIIRVDAQLLQASKESLVAFTEWLKLLLSDQLDAVRDSSPGCARIVMNSDRQVIGEPRLLQDGNPEAWALE